MKYAAVYISEFPIAAWLRTQPEASRQPGVILEGNAPFEHVFSRNHAAQQRGIAHGMSKVQAETCGQVCFHKRSLVKEAEAFADLIKVAEGFSPRIEAVASPAHDYEGAGSPSACILLDRSGTDKLIGTPEQYAARIHNSLKTAGFQANVATADNAESSILLAKSYEGITCPSKDQIQKHLYCLPVSCLRADDNILAIFKKWGIRTLGQLTELPETALISRIGQQGKRLQQVARGVAEHLLIAEEPAFTLSSRVELDSPVELLESLLFIVSPMLEQLIRMAMDRAGALRSITIELVLEKAASHCCTVQPALPSSSRDLLLKLLNLQLQAQPPTAPILGVTLTAESARPQTAQRGLFQAQFPDPDKLDLLIARLRSIAGQDSVGTPALQNSYCPDEFDITTYKPGTVLEVATDRISRLALRCIRPAPCVQVNLRDGIPSAVFWEGFRMPIARASGPWQTSGYWWEARYWHRDEWDAVITYPSYALRLQHDYALNQWSIAGVYD